jgi:hypothetical protein
MHSTTPILRAKNVLLFTLILINLLGYPARADDISDAKAVAAAFLKLTDAENVEGAYKSMGEQWTRTQPKSETIAGLRRWMSAKGGSATVHEIVAQRVMTEEEAHALSPTSTAKGNVYVFRYRSTYPNGSFFEDIYVAKDSDGVLRIQGDTPQPAG